MAERIRRVSLWLAYQLTPRSPSRDPQAARITHLRDERRVRSSLYGTTSRGVMALPGNDKEERA